ncbi:hypothetical protein SUBVAR_07271 [Subdoligranulum variabile DSM 15176]|uniref:Uncharacterized protein n=1 Tax=Subdoligranulum variabile DSM 15176 TaxID=411471 RepID=D1PS88_9FIRM|nr:hypothetical protein SUBVAR_07271 [Subdoligranulum variabile DSM 15176]
MYAFLSRQLYNPSKITDSDGSFLYRKCFLPQNHAFVVDSLFERCCVQSCRGKGRRPPMAV